MDDNFSRRGFLKNATLAMAPAVLPALGANAKIRIGWIGVGSRGYHCINQLYLGSGPLVEVTAVCDTYQGWLNRARDRVQAMGKNTPKTYVDYRDLLADPSVDAVVVSTPEHLHFSMTMAAIKARKHIYVEKPLAHTIEEGAAIVKAAEASGVVVQVGTQNRSSKLYLRAKEMYENGDIGEIHYVRAFWYRNFPDRSGVPAAWRYAIPEDAGPNNTDWDRFLGPAPKRPWDKRRYYQWRNYWDYSGGISTDLLVHQTDISNYVLGKTVPVTCMASGGIYVWGQPDDREVPDTLSAIYEYPDRFHLNYSCFFGNEHFGYGEEFMGYEGTIMVYNRQDLHFYPQKLGGRAPAKVRARREVHLNYLKDFNQEDSTADHFKNWILAIRGEAKAITPARAGQVAAIPGHLATLSYRRGKKALWDPKSEQYRFT
jgi:predicted dehydrogenase